MGDKWDYRLRKMDFAMQMARGIIPEKPQDAGSWTISDYYARSQETLKKLAEMVDAVFPEPAD